MLFSQHLLVQVELLFQFHLHQGWLELRNKYHYSHIHLQGRQLQVELDVGLLEWLQSFRLEMLQVHSKHFRYLEDLQFHRHLYEYVQQFHLDDLLELMFLMEYLLRMNNELSGTMSSPCPPNTNPVISLTERFNS